jgi:hypothetical protein
MISELHKSCSATLRRADDDDGHARDRSRRAGRPNSSGFTVLDEEDVMRKQDTLTKKIDSRSATRCFAASGTGKRDEVNQLFHCSIQGQCSRQVRHHDT